MISTKSLWTLGSAAILLAANMYQGNHDRNHKLCNIGSTEKHIPKICSVCRNQILILFSIMTYYWVCNQSSMTTSGVGTAYPSGTTSFVISDQLRNIYAIYRCFIERAPTIPNLETGWTALWSETFEPSPVLNCWLRPRVGTAYPSRVPEIIPGLSGIRDL
jgi:hypothetical protein